MKYIFTIALLSMTSAMAQEAPAPAPAASPNVTINVSDATDGATVTEIHLAPAPAPSYVFTTNAPETMPVISSHRTAGVGWMEGSVDRQHEYAVAFDGLQQSQSVATKLNPAIAFSSNYALKKLLKTPGEYQHSYGRLEFGTGVGIHAVARGGTNAIGGLREGDHFMPFIALKPADLQLDLNTKHAREDHIEWHFKGAGGVQWAVAECKGTLGVEGGGRLGTLGTGGFSAVAAGDMLITCPGFSFTADAARIFTKGRPVDNADLTVSIPIPGTDMNFGVRGEAIVTYDGTKSVPLTAMPNAIADQNNSPAQKVEARGFATLQGNLPF